MAHGNTPNPYRPVASAIRQSAGDKLKAPGISLIVVGAIGLLLMLGFWGLTLIGFIADPQAAAPPPELKNEAERTGFYIGFYGAMIVPIFNMIAQAIVIFGGICMVRGKGIGMARTGAVLSVIPCLSSFCILGIPFGVWALIVLADANVKRSFG